jgi:hypothetical protein
MGLFDANGDPLTTTVWGYGVGATGGYLGPTLLAEEGARSRSNGRISCR